ncbi:MAG: rod-binding protein [Planctomycetota bacterium JB042]
MRTDPLLPGGPAGIPSQPGGRSVEELDEARAAEEFTTVLMSLVVKEMFKTTAIGGKDDMFGNGPGSDVYRGFAQQAFAEALARHGMDDLVESVRDSIARHRSSEDSK